MVREEPHCHNSLGYSFLMTARDLLYVLSHRQDDTYHNLWSTTHVVLDRMEKSPVIGPLRRFYPVTKTLY